MMKTRIITYIVGVFYIPLLIPLFVKNKDVILADTDRMYKHGRTPFSGVLGILYLLIHNKYFRNVYYERMCITNFVFRLLYPPAETFVLGKNIGPGLYAAHPFATIVNVRKAGKNLSIRNSTTIGNKNVGKNEDCPIIGDNVTIGANVCIIGKISVGNNVTIGAGCVVVKDVPDNAIVVGNPSHIIGYNTTYQE